MLDFPIAEKRKIMFLLHYNQQGGVRNEAASSLNVLKRGLITYYSVNFRQHNAHYDFHSSDMVDVFLDAVHRAIDPERNLIYKFQVYFEIINQ